MTFALLLLAALTSLPAFTKYTSRPLLFTFGHAVVLAGMLVIFSRTASFWNQRRRLALGTCLALCLALAASNGLLYPRTRIPAARSSAPDAMIEPARRLVHGVNPYADVLFDGAPISPGPAWIAIHAPLTVAGLIWLVVPLHLAGAAYMLWQVLPSAAVGLTIFILMLPAFLQMSFVGHDLFAIGCAILATTIGVYRSVSAGGRWLIPWAVAAGLVATARMPLIVLVAALTVLVFARDRRLAGRFLLVAGAVAAGTHLGMFVWTTSLGIRFQPMHVFGRGAGAGLLVPLGFSAILVLAAWQWRRGVTTLVEWLRFVWTVAGLPFVVVGLGELRNHGMDWANWEGKVYAGFTVSLLVAAVLLRIEPRRAARSRASGSDNGRSIV